MLVEQGYEVRLLLHGSSEEDMQLSRMCVAGGATLVSDPASPTAVKRAMHGVSVLVLDLPFTIIGFNNVSDHDAAVHLAQQLVGAATASSPPSVSKIVAVSTALGLLDDYEFPFVLAKRHVEALVEQSGIDYTIFRPVFRMDDLRRFFDKELSEGFLFLPLHPKRPLMMVSEWDISRATCTVILSPDRPEFSNAVLPLAADEQTPIGLLASYNRLRKSEIAYVEIAFQTFSSVSIDLLCLVKFIKDREFDCTVRESKETFPELVSFTPWLEAAIAENERRKALGLPEL